MADYRSEYQTCPQCEGEGRCMAFVHRIGEEAMVTCPRCNGHGRIRVDMVQNDDAG